MSSGNSDERVLIIAPVGQDAAGMAELLDRKGFESRICGSLSECAQLINERAGVLLLTEEALELAGISGLLETLEAQPPWSELPLIILTSGGESRQARLLDTTASAAGSVTLLERPLSSDTLWRSVQVALLSRRQQYQVRDLIHEQQRDQEALQKRAHEQQGLYHLADSLVRARSLAEVYDSGLDSILSALQCERASLALFDTAGVMRFRAWRGLSDLYRSSVEGHSPWQPDEPNPKPVCIEDIDAAPMNEDLRKIIRLEGIGALAFLPLLSNGNLLGKFMIYYRGEHKFGPEELQLAETVAGQLAIGIERKMGEEALDRLVTERTAELRETNEQLEAFVYSIAHDLRAPLRSISGYSQLLVDDQPSGIDPTAQQSLKRIQASAEFMDKLLMDLLAYGRTARAELEITVVDAQKAWETALFQCAILIEQSKARIEQPAPLPPVRANEGTLGQVMANLLANALKFVAPGVPPRVRVWAESKGHSVRLWVQDNGIGIPANQHERIFRIFERLNGSRYTGTGIGLSIVRKGVERMGGHVGLESSPGKGSGFWIELPSTESTANGT